MGQDSVEGEGEGERQTLQFVRQVGSHRYPISSGTYNARHHHILTCDKESLRLWSFRKELRKVSLHCSADKQTSPIHSLHYNSKHDFYIAVTSGSSSGACLEDTQARYAPLQTPPGCILAFGPSLLPLTAPVATGSNFPALSCAFIQESEETVILCGGGELLVWDVVNCNGKACLRKRMMIQTSESHSVLCGDPAGSGRVFSAGGDEVIHVLNVKKGGVCGKVDYSRDKSGEVLCMSYLSTTRTLVLGTNRGLLLTYYASSLDEYRFELLTRFTQHGSGVKCLVYSADLFGVMSCSGDNDVLHSDVVSGEAYGKHVHRHEEAPTSHVPSNRALARPETRNMVPISVEVNGSKRQYMLVMCGELVTILRVFTPMNLIYTCSASLTNVDAVCGGKTIGDVSVSRQDYIGQHHIVARRGPRSVYIMDAANGEVQHGLAPQCEENDVWVSHYKWYDAIERHLVGWSNGAASLLDNRGTVTWQSPCNEEIGSICASVVVDLTSGDYFMVLGTTEGHLCKINLSRGAELSNVAIHSSCVVDLSYKKGLALSAERLGSVKLWNEDWSLLLASYQVHTKTSLHAVYQHSSAIFLGLGNGRLQVLDSEKEGSLPLCEEIAAHGNEVTCIKASWSSQDVLLSGSQDKTILLWRYDCNSLVRQRAIYLPHAAKGAFFSPVKDDIVVYDSHSVSYLSFWQCYSDSCEFSLQLLHHLLSKDSDCDLDIDEHVSSSSVGKPHESEEAKTESRRSLSAIQIKVLSRSFAALAAEMSKYTQNQTGLCVPLEVALPLLKTLGYHEVSLGDVKPLLILHNYQHLDALDLESFLDIADFIVSKHIPVTRTSTADKLSISRKVFSRGRGSKRHGDIGMAKIVVEWNEMGEKRLKKRSMLPNTPVLPRQTPPTRTSSQGNGYVSARDAAMRMVKASKDSKLMSMEWPLELLTAATAESVCRRIFAWKVRAQVPSLLSECVYLYHVAQHGQLCEEMVAKKIEAFITSLYAASRSPLCRCMLFLLGMGPPSHSRANSLLHHAHTLFFHMYTKMQHHLGRFLSTHNIDKSRHVNLSVFLQVATEACQAYTSKTFEVLEQWLTDRVVLYQTVLLDPQVPKHKRAIHFEEGLELVLTLWLQALQDNTFTLPGLSRSRIFISTAEHRSYRSIFTDPAAIQAEEDVWIPSAQLEEDRLPEERPLQPNRRLSLASREDFEVKKNLFTADKPRPYTSELRSSRHLVEEVSNPGQARRVSRVPSIVGIQGSETEVIEGIEGLPGRRRSLSRRGSAASTESFAVGPLQCEARDTTIPSIDGSASTLDGHRSSIDSSIVNMPKVEALREQNHIYGETQQRREPTLEREGESHGETAPSLTTSTEMSLMSADVLDESVEMKPGIESDECFVKENDDLLDPKFTQPGLPVLLRPMSVEGETADQILSDADFKQTQQFVDDMFHSMNEQGLDQTFLEQKLTDEIQLRNPSISQQPESLSNKLHEHAELSEESLLPTSADAINMSQKLRSGRAKSIMMVADSKTMSAEPLEGIMRASSRKSLAGISKASMQEELEEPGQVVTEALTASLGTLEIMDPLRQLESLEELGNQPVDTDSPSSQSGSIRRGQRGPSFSTTQSLENGDGAFVPTGTYYSGDEATPAIEGTTHSSGTNSDPALEKRVPNGEKQNEQVAHAGVGEPNVASPEQETSGQRSVDMGEADSAKGAQGSEEVASVALSSEEVTQEGAIIASRELGPGEVKRSSSKTEQAQGSIHSPLREKELYQRTKSARRIQRWFRSVRYGEEIRNGRLAASDPNSFWSSDDGSIPPEKLKKREPTVSVSSSGELHTLPCAFGDRIRFVPLDLMKTQFSMPHWETKEAIESDSDSDCAGETSKRDQEETAPQKSRPGVTQPKLEPLPTVDVVIKALKNWKEYFVEAERKLFHVAEPSRSPPLSESQTCFEMGEIKEHVQRLRRTRRAHSGGEHDVCKDWRVSRKERLYRAASGEVTLCELEKGTSKSGSVGKNEFAYYTFSHGSPVELLSVRLKLSSGVVDMFISKHSLPTFADYCAKSTTGPRKGAHNITLNPYHEDNVKGDYYIGVFGISDAEFEVFVESIIPTPSRTLRNVEALTSKFRDLSPESACISLQPPVIVRKESPKHEGKTALQEMMQLDEMSHELDERDRDAAQFTFTFPEEEDSESHAGVQDTPETEGSSSPRSESQSTLPPVSTEESFDDPNSRFVSVDLETASTCSSITQVTEAMNFETELKKKPFRLFRSAASYLSTPRVVLYKLRGSQKRKHGYSILVKEEEGSSLPNHRPVNPKLPPLREEAVDQDKVLLGIGFDKFKEILESRPIPDLSIIYRKSNEEVAAARRKSAMRARIRLKELQRKSDSQQR